MKACCAREGHVPYLSTCPLWEHGRRVGAPPPWRRVLWRRYRHTPPREAVAAAMGRVGAGRGALAWQGLARQCLAWQGFASA
eukprot:3475227-Prymnesium_polylepis.2